MKASFMVPIKVIKRKIVVKERKE